MLDSVLELLVELEFQRNDLETDDQGKPSWQSSELSDLKLATITRAPRGWDLRITEKGTTYLKKFGDQKRLALVYLKLDKISHVRERMHYFHLEDLSILLAHPDAGIRIRAKEWLEELLHLRSLRESSKSASKDDQN